jgi:sigma-B regulation protein RsbU (phosphoserine phosphatase)
MIEICNAGHLPPLLFHEGTVKQIDATGLPVGIFCNEHFTANRLQLAKGDTLLLYTDGFSEASNGEGLEYGARRLSDLFRSNSGISPRALLDACMRDWLAFGDGQRTKDDVTLMAIQRTK